MFHGESHSCVGLKDAPIRSGAGKATGEPLAAVVSITWKQPVAREAHGTERSDK